MIRRPSLDDLNELENFFLLVIKDTYEKEGLGDLTDDIYNEVQEKIKYIKEDLTSGGKKRYFLLATIDNELLEPQLMDRVVISFMIIFQN